MTKNLHLKVNNEIELKVLKEEDAIELFMLILKNKNWLEKYIEWIKKIKNPYDLIDFINKNDYKSYYDKMFPFVIVLNSKIIGMISFQNGNSVKKEVEFGYWISEEFSKLGIVTKSAKSLIKFAFSMTDIKSILINCEITNIPSYKIPQKLDFTFIEEKEGEGYYRDAKPVKITYKLEKPI